MNYAHGVRQGRYHHPPRWPAAALLLLLPAGPDLLLIREVSRLATTIVDVTHQLQTVSSYTNSLS